LINARPRTPRAILSETGDASVDDTLIYLRNAFVIDPESILDVWPEVLRYDIRAPNQPEKDLSARGSLQVDDYRSLVSMQVLAV
jgi:hypothetical protein